MGLLTGALFVGWRRQKRHARAYRNERDDLYDHLEALCEAAGIPCCEHCGYCGTCSIDDYCTYCYEEY